MVEIGVGEKVELVGQERRRVDGMVAKCLRHVVGKHSLVVCWRGAARWLGDRLVCDVVTVVVVGRSVVDRSLMLLFGKLRLRYRDWLDEGLLLSLLHLIARTKIHALCKECSKLVML